ncbi:MAG: RimK family alpha-L-glutamate ligase [Gemmatimonadales bacterium]
MRIVTLAARPGWHTDELDRAARERGHEHQLCRYEELVGSLGGRPGLRSGAVELDRADVVLARIIPGGSLEQTIFRVDALHRLTERGVRVVNTARAIERSVDKFWTSSLLECAGLPTPETVVTESAEEAMAAFRRFGDAVIKPLFGSMGLGLVRVNDEDVAWRVFRTIERLQGVFYVQRFVPHEGRDVRAFVVGGRILGAIERASDGWRTNVSRGGKATAITLPHAWADLALRAAAAVEAEYAGVDLLPASDGTVHVLEVNGIPGWEGLQQATGLDVAGAIVDLAIGGVG